VRLRYALLAAIAGFAVARGAVAAPGSTAVDAGPAANAGVTSYAPVFFAGVRPNTALDMVNALPGFSLDTGDSVRGFGGAAGNVLIDGDRPATKNDTLDEILKRIPAASVARIDVIRGGAPGIDMQGKTMIANVIRKKDDGLKLTTAVAPTWLYDGKFAYGLRLEGTKRSGDTSFEGSLLLGTGADDGTGDGPHTITNPAGVVTEHDLEHYFGEGGQDKATAAMETPVLDGKLRIEGSYVHNPYFSKNDDISDLPADQQTEIYKQNQDTGEIGLRYVRRFGPKVGLEVYALQQLSNFGEYDNLGTPFDDTLFTLSKHQGESIVRGILTFDPWSNLQVQAGVEGDYNWLTSRTFEFDAGAPVFVPAADVHVTETRGEAFVDSTWRATPQLTFETGLRVEASTIASTGDVVSTETFVFPKPRLVATWSPTKVDQLQLRVEREVGQLDFSDFAASGTLGTGEHAGNPTLTPQQDWVIEATYDRRFWKGGDASLTARQYWLQDAIDFAPFCPPGDLLPGSPPACNPLDEYDAPANIGAGWKRELTASLTLPTDKLWLTNGQLILRATWRASQVIDPSTHLPREISGLHPVDAEAHYQQGLAGLKSTWGFDVFPAWRQTEYQFDEIDTQRLGLWVDAFFEYRPRPDFSIKVEADNITSHGLEQVRAFYDPYRDVDGGALSSIDNRSPRFGPELTIRARKTFG
jgi:hypothetical protein